MPVIQCIDFFCPWSNPVWRRPHSTSLVVPLRKTPAVRLLICFSHPTNRQICHPENCLRDLLPPKRDHSVSLRLRHPTVYPIPQVRTNRYCSFINYALKKYQWIDHTFYDYCCTILFILYFVVFPCIFFVAYRYSIVLAIFASVLVL